MRNLKRALSLALASVMLLGMMVVGTSAASYPDVDENDNIEAIEVLNAIKVMIGDRGNFNPDKAVNRHEMAVIMAKLVLGNEIADNYVGTHPFTDVASWADKYVAACYENGIAAGTSKTTFGGDQPLTAVQAAAFMLRALGYKDLSKGASDWSVPVTAKANEIRLFNGVASNPKEQLTRNQVAQLALNTLKSPMVTTTDNTFDVSNGEGNVIISGGSMKYEVRSSSEAYARAINNTEVEGNGANGVGGCTIELGEHLYNGKLELRDKQTDDFGRPARTWFFNGSTVGTYAKDELLIASYTDEVKGRVLYEKLGSSTIRNSQLDVYLDGHDNTARVTKNNLVRSNDSKLADTGRGVITEVYLDTDWDRNGTPQGFDNLITIVSINTFLAQANNDYSDKSENLSMTIYCAGNSGSYAAGPVSKLVDVDDVPAIADVKKDDWMLVQWADDESNVGSKSVVKIMTPEVLTDQKVTSFKRSEAEYNGTTTGSDGKVTELIAAGETYKNNFNSYYKVNTLNDLDANALVNKTYNVYLDQFGNFIGVELFSGKDQYVFITGYDRPTSAIGISTAKAAAIFTDGTMSTIDVNVTDSDKNYENMDTDKDTPGIQTPAGYSKWKDNPGDKVREEKWYTYTLSGGVYTLTPVEGWTRTLMTAEETINCSNVRLVVAGDNSWLREDTDKEVLYAKNGTGRSYGNDKSVYLTVNYGTVDGGVDLYKKADHTTDNGQIRTGITEVSGVYTGVQNVKLVCPANSWVNAVYDTDNNYIVAAVVRGEAEGVVDNYAYIRSGATLERIEETTTKAGDNVTHYWTFDAIMNGEVTTKTIKSKFTDTIRALKPGTVQELIMDSDGYVTKIRDLANSLSSGVEVIDPDTSSDKVYTNYDYLNNTSKVKPDSNDLADYNVYALDIAGYGATGKDIYGANAIGTTVSTLAHVSGTKYYSNITFEANTLYFDVSNANDKGLTVMADAKAVVRQQVNGKNDYVEYSSVETAFRALYDADNNTATNNASGTQKQFCGKVVAVLNSTGRAEWVFFEDLTKQPTKIETSNPDAVINAGSTVNEVNTALQNNTYVRISGNWLPKGLLPGEISADGLTLVIPANHTLEITGDFTAHNNLTIDARNGAKLIVGGDMKTGTNTKNINYALTVTGTLTTVDDTVISSEVNAGNVVVPDAAGAVMEIRSTGKLKVTGSLSRPTQVETTSIDVYGTLDVDGSITMGNANGTVNVYSVTSLYVDGTLNAKLVVGDGSTNAGKAVIGKLDGDLDVKANSTNVVEISNGIAKADASTLSVAIAGGNVTIANGIKAATGQTKTVTISNAVIDIEVKESVAGSDTITVSGTTTGTLSEVKADKANAVTISGTGTDGIKLENVTSATNGAIVANDGDVAFTGTLDATAAAITATTNAEVTIKAGTEVTGSVGALVAAKPDGSSTNVSDTTQDVTLGFSGATDETAGAASGGTTGTEPETPVVVEDIKSTSTLIGGVGTMPTKIAGLTSAEWSSAEDAAKTAIYTYATAMTEWKAELMAAIAANPGVYTIDEKTTRAFNWEKKTSTVGTEGEYSGQQYYMTAADGDYYVSGWMLDLPGAGENPAGKGRIVISYTGGAAATLKITAKNGTEPALSINLRGGVTKGAYVADARTLTEDTEYTWLIVDANNTVLDSGSFKWKPFAGITAKDTVGIGAQA